MSDHAVIEEVVEGPEARRQRRESPERQMTEDRAPSVSIETLAPSGPTPEEALADAQKALAARDSELEATRRREAALRTDAAAARDETARARQRGTAERHTTLEAENARAKSDKAAAVSAIKTARDAGDLDAEMKALESFNSADYRINSTTSELAQLKGGGEMQMTDPEKRAPAGDGTAPRAGEITPAAREWIGRHPRFNSDQAYKRALLAADNEAKLDGIIPDSPAYFRALDAAHADFERGEGGGRRRNNDGDNEMDDRNNGGRRQASSEALPSSRSSGGNGGGAKSVKTALGTVSVTKRADGKIAIQIPPAIRADFEEGAKITNMDLGSYALEQVKIAEEVAAGGTGGLIREEGSLWK